jgi:hypothetical protein
MLIYWLLTQRTENIHVLCIQFKENEMGTAYSTHGRGDKCIPVLVGKSEEKRPLGRHRRRWESNNEMGLKEIGWGRRLDSSGSRCGPMAGLCEDGNEPTGSVKVLIPWIADSRRNQPHGISYRALQWILNHNVQPLQFLDSVSLVTSDIVMIESYALLRSMYIPGVNLVSDICYRDWSL